MKKLLLGALLLILATAQVQAQNDTVITSMMTRRVLRCEDILYNTMALVPELYKSGNRDTLEAVIAFHKKRCPYYNSLLDFDILYAIDKGTFNTETYQNKGLFPTLRSYAQLLPSAGSGKDAGFNTGVNNDETTRNYYIFLQQMAVRLSSRKLPDEQALLVQYYAQPSDTVLDRINTRTFDRTPLKTEYLADQERNDPRVGYHYSLMGGIWIPTGKLSLLGNHPYLGFQIGGRGQRLMVNVSIIIKFLDSKNYYNVYKADSLYSSNNFLGGYIGLDGSYALIKSRRHEWDALGGFGWDGFDALSVERKDDRKLTKSVNSVNFNLGTGYKYFFGKQGAYIGLDAKYNFLFYDNKGGTDVSGNAFSIGLVLGFSGH